MLNTLNKTLNLRCPMKNSVEKWRAIRRMVGFNL